MKNHLTIFTFIALYMFCFPVFAQEEESWGEESWGEESSSGSENPFATSEEEEEEVPQIKYGKEVRNTCRRDELRKKVKLSLKPYRYCNAKTTTISFRRYPYKQQIVVPVYRFMQHILVFNTEGLNQEIRIRIYDAPMYDDTKELLYEADTDSGQDMYELPYEYVGSKLFIEYSIPATEQEDDNYVDKGCVVFMMGYLDEENIED